MGSFRKYLFENISEMKANIKATLTNICFGKYLDSQKSNERFGLHFSVDVVFQLLPLLSLYKCLLFIVKKSIIKQIRNNQFFWIPYT